ncbi:MAG: GGDEF domain-containing protein [Nitrosomonadales bacterium]|nr:GGDEF domain-containing protein [Nitrosomonadales bacterium]
MNLDSRTLLFSLILVNTLMVLSLVVAASNRTYPGKQDGMGKWAAAMLLETLTWILAAARGAIPDFLSIAVANGCKAAAHALVLAAIFEFQRRRAPRWQYLAPVALTLVIMITLQDDMRGRFIWGGLIFAFQMVLIGRALLSDHETRAGRAWRLMFAGIVMTVLVIAIRTIVALSGPIEFAQPQNSIAPHWIQIVAYVGVMAAALLGSMGFVLLVKERTDREIMHLAMTDSLTQVPNRRALIEHAERSLARRSGLPLVLLMIDIDHFKRINDTYGHPTGDEVLREVARLLVQRLRGHDLLGRYGGEEFCVIAPETNAEGARVLAESLRQAIAAARFATDSGEISVTVSIGYSLCQAKLVRELPEVLSEADAALYIAKQTGRNKVACFGEVNPIAHHMLARDAA